MSLLLLQAVQMKEQIFREFEDNVGGHVDTAGRRMISFIGCEECCGYLTQWLDELCGTASASDWANNDGQGTLAQYWDTAFCWRYWGSLRLVVSRSL